MQAHLIIFILAIFSMSSCKSKQVLTQNIQEEMLIIGHGGGFSGHSVEYRIFPDGHIIRQNSLDNSTEKMKSVTKEVYAQIISNYHSLGLGNLEMNQPDNMYYYTIYHTEGKTQKLVWNTNDTSESQAKLQLFFNTVLHRVKS